LVEAAQHRKLNDYGRFAEAAAALAIAKLVVALAPFRTIASLAGWEGARSSPIVDNEGVANSVVLAVNRASRRLPMRCVCIHEGLATQLMLRRRGLPSLFHYGVRQADDRLGAHVWVSLNGTILIGEVEASRHAAVATFPDHGR
jgi:transglutaminase superfamily protein